jgi:hypothetical protein
VSQPLTFVAIAIQKRLAKAKKRRVGQDVILQHDGLVGLGKDPIQPGSHAQSAVQIVVRVVAFDLAGPIHVGDDGAALCTERRVFWMLCPRPVGHHEETVRAGGADCCPDLAHQLRAIEDDQHDGRVQVFMLGTWRNCTT